MSWLWGLYDQPLKDFIFSPEERFLLVKKALKAIPNISVMGYSGLTVEFCRNNNIQAIVRGLRVFLILSLSSAWPWRITALPLK